jgi:hypothetical protein
VKWDELQHVILACNPAIEDLLLTSRDAAMRHIQGGHQFHLNLNPFNIVEIEVTCINSTNST